MCFSVCMQEESFYKNGQMNSNILYRYFRLIIATLL